MQYKLFSTIDYTKSASISLEQARLHHTTQVVTSKRFTRIICNYQSSIQFYINNITRCLCIVVLLSARRKDHQFVTLTKCYNLLQVYNLQIAQQSSVAQITLKSQPILILRHISIQENKICLYSLHYNTFYCPFYIILCKIIRPWQHQQQHQHHVCETYW